MSVGFKFSLIPFPLKKADVIGHVFTPYSSRATLQAINKQKVNIQWKESYKCVRYPIKARREHLQQSRIIKSNAANVMPCMKE